MTRRLLTSIILLLVVGGGEGTDPPFSLLRLSIAHKEMKTMGENPKGVGIGKKENKCALLSFFFLKKNVCRQANAFQLCIINFNDFLINPT